MFALYPHMNVRKNIIYPLVSQGLKRAQINKKLDEVVDILGIADILDQPIGGLLVVIGNVSPWDVLLCATPKPLRWMSLWGRLMPNFATYGP